MVFSTKRRLALAGCLVAFGVGPTATFGQGLLNGDQETILVRTVEATIAAEVCPHTALNEPVIDGDLSSVGLTESLLEEPGVVEHTRFIADMTRLNMEHMGQATWCSWALRQYGDISSGRPTYLRPL